MMRTRRLLDVCECCHLSRDYNLDGTLEELEELGEDEAEDGVEE